LLWWGLGEKAVRVTGRSTVFLSALQLRMIQLRRIFVRTQRISLVIAIK